MSRCKHLTAGEEFDIRIKKAFTYTQGAMELGLPKETVVQELAKVLFDDDLMDDVYYEDMAEQERLRENGEFDDEF